MDFAQYLITNDVQIPYSETEGYVPVTKRRLIPMSTGNIWHLAEVMIMSTTA